MCNWNVCDAMRVPCALMAVVYLMVAWVGGAHDAGHAALVPIPEYSGTQASGANARVAAEAFLSALSAVQRGNIIFALDAEERAGWSNLPASSVTRAGLKVADLSDRQVHLLFAFLSASLSEEGYNTIGETLAAEAILSMDERAVRLQWAPENYWLSFYGVPSATEAWGWQFGGHHLSVSIAIEQDVITSMSPTFVGAEPSIFVYDGVVYAPVRDMHRAGIRIYGALSTPQKRRATSLRRWERRISSGPGQDGVIPAPRGVAVSDLADAQQALVLRAIREWVHIQPDERASTRMAELEQELQQMRFAWAGAADGTGNNYFRIQGPTLIIELLSEGNDVDMRGENFGHYHTMYRDTSNEYGGQK